MTENDTAPESDAEWAATAPREIIVVSEETFAALEAALDASESGLSIDTAPEDPAAFDAWLLSD